MRDNRFRETRVVVEGSGTFPADMLRYDSCVPYASVDAGLMDGYQPERRVRLRRFSPDGSKATAARWAAFGWKVIEDGGK